ncbi:hypothetical protein PYCCODRAFT_1502041 [Trametes coccinea BRFM310]|uniref:RNase H type-1 domain-containing protein n=1 Tax=Trametes coccinea (strain BRFM310) TaxID=1353009 RepID=A0A1Y2IKY4_TRAC3|nr:hypothetical protein PYCCODRAFT_1502041 [Trametes coccinea BRFM310]
MNRAIKLPSHLPQTNQSGEIIAALISARDTAPGTHLIQETDAKTVLEALTKYRTKNEDAGYIGVRNGAILKATVAALRSRKTFVALKWVKGHSGHERNEGADRMAAEAVSKRTEDEVDLTPLTGYSMSGAKLASISQRTAYRAIRMTKEESAETRPATRKMIEMAIRDLEIHGGCKPTDKNVWKALRKQHVTREQRQYLWKALHDAFMIGRHWDRPAMKPELRARGVCAHCNVTESMNHILFECQSEGQERIWDLTQSIWRSATDKTIQPCWGTVILAPCVRIYSDGTKRLRTLESRWTILALEAAHLIWRLRCERVIQNANKGFTAPEVEARWRAAINGRISMDRWMTSASLGKRALNVAEVEEIWQPLLGNNKNLPAEWVRTSGVLVGIRVLT